MNRSTLVLLPAAAAALVLGAAGPATADIANPNASCVGLALSDHAVSDGPGAISQQMAWLRGNAGSFGYRNSGQVVRRWAGVHAGSHVPGCEDAIVDILVTGP
jgi:hypothetical protein